MEFYCLLVFCTFGDNQASFDYTVEMEVLKDNNVQ